jgi:3-hydroxyisobutyrate dehydrogenase-like beta-hydroxyacid dehydrogenase
LKLLNNYVALTNQAAPVRRWRLPIAWASTGRLLGGSQPCPGASFILERKLSALVAHDYRPGFFVDLAWKDLRLALELAERAGARTEVARQAWELYGEASRAGFGRLDSSGLLNLLEPVAGA